MRGEGGDEGREFTLSTSPVLLHIVVRQSTQTQEEIRNQNIICSSCVEIVGNHRSKWNLSDSACKWLKTRSLIRLVVSCPDRTSEHIIQETSKLTCACMLRSWDTTPLCLRLPLVRCAPARRLSRRMIASRGSRFAES